MRNSLASCRRRRRHYSSSSSKAREDGREFEARVRSYVQQVLMYEDPVRQEYALKSVDADELEEKALVSLAKERKFEPSKYEKDHAFQMQLLFWFKQSFRWVNSPSCDKCGSQTSNIGCWLIYRVADDRLYDLDSYELMSANDAPERDPMSWIVEGSEDGRHYLGYFRQTGFSVFF